MIRSAVTLTHEEAATVAATLRAYASTQWGVARRTPHPTVRSIAEQRGNAANALEDVIVRRMFADQTDTPDAR